MIYTKELSDFRIKHGETLKQVVEQQYLTNGMDFINDMQTLHQLIYKTKFVHNCSSCVMDAAKKIYKL